MDFSGKYNNLSGIFHHFPDKKNCGAVGRRSFFVVIDN
jgi:hypothetical protein